MTKSNINVNEGQVTFKRVEGHKHDGLTSSLIDTTKYSIFDFVASENTRDTTRRSRQENNKNVLRTFIVDTIEGRVLNPEGIRIQANAITAREIVAGTITADELSSNIVLVNNVIRSVNYINNSDTKRGWAIFSNGDANFSNVNIRGNIASGDGIYNNINTPFFANIGGYFSLKNKFTWDGNSLSINANNVTLGSNLTWNGSTLTIRGTLQFADGSTPGTFDNGDAITGGSIGGVTISSSSIYAGAGSWANPNTPFYLDNSGFFSLEDKLYWNPSSNSLTISGSVTASSISGSTVTGSTVTSDNGSRGVTMTDGYIKGLYSVGIEFRGSTGTDYTYISGGTIGTDYISVSNGTIDIALDPGNTPKSISTTGGVEIGQGKFYRAVVSFPGTASSTTARMSQGDVPGYDVIARPSSLRALKENIQDVQNALGIISDLRPRTYNFKVDAFYPVDPNTGFEWTEEARQIAQLDVKYGLIVEEVAEKRPELLSYSHDKYDGEPYGEGSYFDLSSWKPTMWEDADVLVICVKAIQELLQKVKSLESIIDNQEGV